MAKRTPPPNIGLSYTFTGRDVRRGRTHNPPGFQYTSKGKACADKYGRIEKGCKTQLTFQNGVPLLRFCKTAGKPGVLVPVQSAEEAVRVSRAGCACLSGKTLKQAAACFPNSVGLGRVRSRR
jgi:hypothetical protein